MLFYRRKILNLALPAMAENILQMLMGVIDNYLVAQISLLAVSGVAMANNIITVYQALFVALSAAISSLVARSVGEKDRTKLLKYIADAIWLTILVSVVLGMITLLFGEITLLSLGASPQLAQMGNHYFRVVGGMIISLGLLTTLGAILRAQGNAKLPMQVSLLANVLNAFLSALSIYLLDFGIMGVAWSTVISRMIGILVLASRLPIKEAFQEMNFHVDRDIWKLSLPAAGERLMMRIGDVLILIIIVNFGTKVLAGNAIGETLTQFNYMPGLGLSTATVILVASFIGSGRDKEVPRLIKETFCLSCLLMLGLGLFTYVVGPYVLPFFTSDKLAQESSMVVLLFSLLSAPATAGTLIYTALWQGLGNTRLPFYATTIGMWLVRILVGYFLGIILNAGLSGVWLATALDNLSRWAILGYLYKKYERVFP
ncbi:MATE family efflux transporter [Streptococcus didelphis]|uniref:Probable multidrug resistance protein NorM n=1 Tax=Streptococcus didelphis TaxID=102886 RepID=A0ABY9LF87_9STRE|nr:MATE family efflux transporter [Streptococcus didelphis]WMB27595.1 MATE family efflux transporter [Streptococcus didelphis]